MQFQFEYVSVAFPNLQVPIGKLYNKPDQKVQILGVVFLILFTLVLFLQFLSMLFHRWGTIVEILASTRLFNKHHKYKDTKLSIQEAVDLIKEMELEKQDQFFDPTSTASSINDDENGPGSSDEPDPDYDEDILPEPEPDYFDHPAVNNEHNWNEPLRLMSPAQRHQNQFNMSSSYNHHHANNMLMMSPAQRYHHHGNHHHHNDINNNNPNQVNSSFSYSPRHGGHLKPLQSLDVRVMRQFRALELRDPRFKRKIQQIQFMTNRLNSPTNNNNMADMGFNV